MTSHIRWWKWDSSPDVPSKWTTHHCSVRDTRIGNVLVTESIWIQCYVSSLSVNIPWGGHMAFGILTQHWHFPYPEPVYTGWSSVHWNATGMPLVDPVYTGTPLEKLSWNSPTLECHWRNLVESAPHWDATGETLTFTSYTGTPLGGLWQPTHAPTHRV